jgi:NAD(P)-dependent dehydrogenase (short-subunit alcohol dehydrogenase family)
VAVERSLTGKVVAVTGGARGIGRATAQALTRAGARVAIGDLDAELAARTGAEVGALGLGVDVTDRDSFAGFLEEVEAALGPLDVLVNNAGILHLGPFLEEDDASTRRQFDVNVFGVVNGMRLAIPRLLERPEGHVVNVASSAAKVAPPGIASYAATKHAVAGLTEAVRAEHAGSGLEFSIVMPGVVKTEMIAGYEDTRRVRRVEAADVADAIVAALRRPRVDVFVPREVGLLARTVAVLPRRAREAVEHALRVDRLTWNADRSQRAAYEARAAASDPAHEPAARG